jgi:hypothetical protein
VSRRLERDQVIDVMNSRYSFSVRRAADADALKPFSLKYRERWQQDAPQPQAGWIDAAELKLAMVATISWLPMETILTDADFQMTGADSRVNDQGDEVVRIVCSCRRSDPACRLAIGIACLIAWVAPDEAPAATDFRVVAHTVW